MATDINLNSAQCIRTMSDWGQDTVHNICNGSQTVIQWGTMDYAGWVVGGSLLAAVGLIILGFGAFVVKETFFGY